jgi:FG-GAP-like repeat
MESATIASGLRSACERGLVQPLLRLSMTTRPKALFRIVLIVSVAMSYNLYVANESRGQGATTDEGHCTRDAEVVLACWNFSAGSQIPIDYNTAPEYLPLMHGWDFRINLPHVRFQLARPDFGSALAMVGVVEDATPLHESSDPKVPSTLTDYGHQDNTIWLFRTDKVDGKIRFKALPSRRGSSSAGPQNVASLTGDWRTAGGNEAPTFRDEPSAVAVIGEGIGNATIYLVARDRANKLHFTRRSIVDTGTTTWPESWEPLNVQSAVPPVLATAFDGRLALATHTGTATSRMEVRLYDPGTETWGEPAEAGLAEAKTPKLVWDGQALNLFYLLNGRLQHTSSSSAAPLLWRAPTEVSALRVYFSGFDVIAFNNRLHVVIRRDTDTPAPHAVWYTSSTTPPGEPSQWAPASLALSTTRNPRIASHYENIYVLGVDNSNRVIHVRKDPNRPGNDLVGTNFADRWLDRGTVVDTTMPGAFFDLSTLSFNSDLYLAVNKAQSGSSVRGTYIVNYGRAAMKHLLSEKWGTALVYGGAGRFSADLAQFAPNDATMALGDFNGDHDSDLVKFTQKAEAQVGPAPVYVALRNDASLPGFAEPERWHKYFALEGEIPMVGDFNGDGFDDIVSFTQARQEYSDGSAIGPAVVWVALNEPVPGSSGRRRFGTSRVWHRFFSLKGEIPMVGDFDGDGDDDIVTFTQSSQKDADGNTIGPAVVWVALSNRSSFDTSKIWHRFFSLEGELPAVGDFNGDGKTDIISFTQEAQFDAAGNRIGQAPVWVSLSDGRRFATSRIWHTFFSLRGEVPQVGDFNMDGKDDIITFLAGKGRKGYERSSFVAYSSGATFSRSALWASDFVGADQVRLGDDHIVRSPLIAANGNLSDITNDNADGGLYIPTVFAFRDDGNIHSVSLMFGVPYPAGAPWEFYKWFPEKALGAAQFPEWIYLTGPDHCISPTHRFRLGGAAGSGGADQLTSSVRRGGRAAHILQELGHSIFASCFRSNKDPFGLYSAIFAQPLDQGGFGAGMIADICVQGDLGDYYDCRTGESSRDARAEHIFLGLMVKYRLDGDEYRARISTETNPTYRAQLQAAYTWLRDVWYDGLEFKRGAQLGASLVQDGVPCLPGECSI